MNKTLKTILIVLAILAVVAGAIVFAVISIHNSRYISKDQAIEIAIADSGVDKTAIIKTEADFEKTNYAAWYEVEFDSHTDEYNYDIDAVSGKILSSNKEMRD